MLLQARKDGSSIKIVLEQFDLALIRKIIASRIEIVDVNSWKGDIVQVLVQTLLCGQISTVGEMIVKLVVSELLVNVFISLGILPLNIEDLAAMTGILHPAFRFRSPLDILVLRSETKNNRVLFLALC